MRDAVALCCAGISEWWCALKVCKRNRDIDFGDEECEEFFSDIKPKLGLNYIYCLLKQKLKML